MPPRKTKDKRPISVILKESAQKLFAEYGFERTTVRMIASEANIAQSQITFNFGSKEGLYQSIIADIIEGIRNTYKPINAQIEKLRETNELTEDLCWYYIEFFVETLINRALDPDYHYQMRLVSMGGNSPCKGDEDSISKCIITNIELPLAHLIMNTSNNIKYLRARTISRAINGSITSFGEHENLFVNEIVNGTHMPDAYDWMIKYLRLYILDSIRAAGRTQFLAGTEESDIHNDGLK